MTIMSKHNYSQNGSTLIEALIAMAIFAISILALIAMQGFAIRANSENQYRGQAAYLANSLIGEMWATRANLAAFEFNEDKTCDDSSNPTSPVSTSVLGKWLATINSTLPNASQKRQSVTVSSVTNLGANQVTVTICWQNTSGGDVRRFTTTTLIPTT